MTDGTSWYADTEKLTNDERIRAASLDSRSLNFPHKFHKRYRLMTTRKDLIKINSLTVVLSRIYIGIDSLRYIIFLN